MFDQFGIYSFSVIEHEDKLRAYYAGWTRCESVPFNTTIGVAESRDGGETFTRLGPGPVIPYTPHEPFVISGPKIRRFSDKWYLWYIAGRKWILDEGRPEPVYKIRMATSDDGLRWVKYGEDLLESRIEADEAQASPDVIFSGGRYHMFLCYRRSRQYRGKSGGYSLDTLHRDARHAGLDVVYQTGIFSKALANFQWDQLLHTGQQYSVNALTDSSGTSAVDTGINNGGLAHCSRVRRLVIGFRSVRQLPEGLQYPQPAGKPTKRQRGNAAPGNQSPRDPSWPTAIDNARRRNRDC